MKRTPLALALAAMGCAGPSPSQSYAGLDLRDVDDSELLRVYGSIGDGSLGLAVAGGFDLDGDGLRDAAFAAMQATVRDAPGGGRVYVVFGNGELAGSLDTGVSDARILALDGARPFEYTGSELWMDDVTGDGIGDLLIGRQNYTPFAGDPDERIAAGALSVIVGGPSLRRLAAKLTPVELDAPGPDVTVSTLLGSHAGSRLGIWMRTGDVDGDGVSDIVVGADQDDSTIARGGAVYVILGGPHLETEETVDMAALDAAPLAGYVAKLTPPALPLPLGYHFGGTCQIADLDGNGRGEVLVAAAFNRAGAVLDVLGGTSAASSGGSPRGTAFIAWDDNFPPPPWPSAFAFRIDEGAGAHTVIAGSRGNVSFGEELLGGMDWDLDGNSDLFIGDIAANFSGRPNAGSGHVIYDARRLKGVQGELAELAELAPPVRTTTLLGAAPGDISGDTAAQGDFSGDGNADLVVCSPHASPLRRHSAGTLHVLAGRLGGWPARVDLRSDADRRALGAVEIYGAQGTFGTDRGDTLCYSAAAGDLNGDGRSDLVTNEMVGNGLAPRAVNVGNLLLIDGELLFPSHSGPKSSISEKQRPTKSSVSSTPSSSDRIGSGTLGVRRR